MSILIQNAILMTMDPQHGTDCFISDLWIENDRIAAFGAAPPGARADTVIDGRHRLVMPGLVNAHIHSWETFLKGRYDNMPLEVWMLYSYPILGATPLSARAIRLRSLLCAIESLKAGVTMLVDDVIEMPGQSLEQIGAVAGAYEEAGIRAAISGNIMNVPMPDTLPYASEILPKEIIEEARRKPMPTVAEYLDFSRAALAKFHGRAGRLSYVIAPSGPQRCTPDLLAAAHELARSADTAYHIHVLETKVQAVTGREFYGKTLVRYLHDLGVLSERTTMAHSIWVTDEDIARMGAARCSAVHNPKSNAKLASGVMPFRKLLDAGVNVALGTDGVSGNDSHRMFDVITWTALLHKLTTPERKKWPTADEVLRCATLGGARSAMRGGETGSLEPGKKADVLVIDLRTLNFTPLNDVRNQLVYCEDGSSIEYVIVDGKIVVKGGKLTTLNEESVLEEIRAFAPEFLRHHAEVEQLNRALEPYFDQICTRCAREQIGINRRAVEPGEW